MTMPSNKWEETLDEAIWQFQTEIQDATNRQVMTRYATDYRIKLKLALTNAVRELVIGEDEKLPTRPLTALDGAEWEEFETIRHRNRLRAEQRANLLKAIGDPPM